MLEHLEFARANQKEKFTAAWANQKEKFTAARANQKEKFTAAWVSRTETLIVVAHSKIASSGQSEVD